MKEEQILEIIKESRTIEEKCGIGIREEQARQQVVVDIINKRLIPQEEGEEGEARKRVGEKPFDKENWEERFDIEFPKWPESTPGAGEGIGPLAGVGMYMQYDADRRHRDEEIEKIKSFISQEIQKAKAEQEEEIIKMIEKMKTSLK